MVGAVLVRVVLITLVIGAALQPDAASTAFAVRQTGDAAARAIPHARGERVRDEASPPAASSTENASTAIAYPDGPALPWSPGETSSISLRGPPYAPMGIPPPMILPSVVRSGRTS